MIGVIALGIVVLYIGHGDLILPKSPPGRASTCGVDGSVNAPGSCVLGMIVETPGRVSEDKLVRWGGGEGPAW